ncbi:MAG TPA: MFS transporter [Candidatus Limnocylindrales bacterium]|nr:MFS transporter [Candidatus Limnocylindrales bacterium]
MEAVAVAAGVDPALADALEADDRPTERLPLRQLLQISIYWFGITSIMGGIGVVVQKQIPAFVSGDLQGPAIALQSLLTTIMAAAIQPTIGMVSDFTISKWGRRKPFIAVGATLDILFLIGIGTANTYLTLVVFLVAIQFSSNFAQGPFQGYIPDLVPGEQVGLASALVGIMQTLGFVLGNIIIAFGVATHAYLLPLLFLGFIEVASAVGTIVWVREGRAARDRKGRSWLQIARLAWSTDILKERSFVNLVLSRLLFLAGTNMLLGFDIIFMQQTLGLSDADQGTWITITGATVALLTVVSTLPSARISDRIGRKPVIYAACAIGAVGLVVLALAPSIQVFLVGAVLIGIASGTFVAVDWALMTDIIPKASSGRYMGISNIAVAGGGPLAAAIGGVMLFFVGGAARVPEGPRSAYLVAVIVFIGAAFFLRRVDPRPRGERLAAETAQAAGATA